MFSNKKNYPKYYSYHGRKISKKISAFKINLLNKYYDKFSIDDYIIKYHIEQNIPKKFDILENHEKVNIEIGFGDGEFLIKNAISNPRELFIGSEVYLNGITRVLSIILENQIKNIILSNLNSVYFLEALPSKSIDKIFIINPDPWLKKRHHKRRLMSYKILKLLVKIIKSKNSIYMTTDSVHYMNDTQNLLNIYKDLIGKYSSSTLRESDELYGISKYQRKAIEKGLNIYQFII